MNHTTSPWPATRRTRALTLGPGVLLLLVVLLALAGVVDLPGTVVVGAATVASALLIAGLLGWGGRWVEALESSAGDAAEHGSGGEAAVAEAGGAAVADEDASEDETATASD